MVSRRLLCFLCSLTQPCGAVPIGEGSYRASSQVEGANVCYEERVRDWWGEAQPV